MDIKKEKIKSKHDIINILYKLMRYAEHAISKGEDRKSFVITCLYEIVNASFDGDSDLKAILLTFIQEDIPEIIDSTILLSGFVNRNRRLFRCCR